MGMPIGFDDYFCCSNKRMSGERRAFLGFEKTNPDWNFVPYMNIAWSGLNFIVEHAHLR